MKPALLCAMLATLAAGSARADCGALDRWLAVMGAADDIAAITLTAQVPMPAAREDVTCLIAQLQHENASVRRAVVRALGDVTIAPEQIAPALIRVMESGDDATRDEVLIAIGKHAATAAPLLAPRFRELTPPDDFRRGGQSKDAAPVVAAAALLAGGPTAAPAVIAVARDAEPYTRAVAASLLEEIGPGAVPALHPLLRDRDPAIRLFAADVILRVTPGDAKACATAGALLGNHETRRRTVPVSWSCAELGRFIASRAVAHDERLRKAAFDAAGWTMDEAGPDTAAKILRAVARSRFRDEEDADDIYRWASAELAATLRDHVVPVLRRRLKSRDPAKRIAALEVLEEIGRPAASATSDIRAALRDDDPKVRDKALDALARVADPATALSVLVPMLRDEATAETAADLIGSLGSAAAPAIPALLEAVWSDAGNALVDVLSEIGAGAVPALLQLWQTAPEASTRGYALSVAAALADEGDGRVGKAIRDALAHPDPEVASAGVSALRTVKPADVEAVVSLLSHDHDELRRNVLKLLTQAGPVAQAAAPRLRAYYAETSDYEALLALLAIGGLDAEAVRETLADAPIRLDGLSAEAAAVIAASIATGDSEVMKNAVDSLMWSGAPPSVVPNMARALEHDDLSIRLHAIVMLGGFGPEAIGVRDAIVQRLIDPDEDVRRAAAAALDQIDPAIDLPAYHTIVMDDVVATTAGALRDAVRYAQLATGPLTETITVSAGSAEPRYPRFPIPPPRSSAQDVFERRRLGRDHDTLGAVHGRLSSALRRLGYEQLGVFETAGDGFAVMTKIERVRDDGRPYPVPDRWTRDRIAPDSPLAYAKALFVEPPGRFRCIVFLVTTLDHLGHASRAMTEEEADLLHKRSARLLPPKLAAKKYAGHHSYVVIYSFLKKPGRRARLVEDDEFGVLGNLGAAGILRQLPTQ